MYLIIQKFNFRLLSCLVSSLDTYILLQCQYNIIEILLQSQKNNRLDENSEVIIDALSIERNYILVKTHIIGGPNERVIPERTHLDVRIKKIHTHTYVKRIETS